MLVWVYTCQNTTLLEITCRGSNVNYTCGVCECNNTMFIFHSGCFLFHRPNIIMAGEI